MSRGGKRPGAGRKPGAHNRASQKRQEEVAASGVTPLDYLIKVMRDEGEEKGARLDAAKAAAPYVHPRLSSVDVKADINVSHEDALRELE